MTSFTATTPLYFSCLLVIIIIKSYLFNLKVITNLNKKGKSSKIVSSGSCTRGIPPDHENKLLAIKRV